MSVPMSAEILISKNGDSKNAVSHEQEIWIDEYRYLSLVFKSFFFHSGYCVSVTVFAHYISDVFIYLGMMMTSLNDSSLILK